ncbi:MAG TPA: TonB family protein [Vicinamibacterales bacterium]|nr:TonB family protein [Vicinamibacterales bacterium]
MSGMATPNLPGTPAPTFESKHLHVRPEGVGPAEFRFTFEMQEKRIGNALGLSVGGHLAAVLLVFLIARMLPEKVYESVLPDRLPDIVWLAQPGPGGGGGGGGNKSPDPPKKVELKGEKPVTVPVKETPVEVKKEPEPEPEVKIPAETAAAAPVVAPGAIESTQASTDSQGKGELGGGGSGRGTGIGSGEGSGLGAGSGGGTGGGTYRPGNGVTIPQLVREVKPAYTADAMRAKVQGTVWLECVVMPDGTVGRVEVVRSLDSTFGLDQEAIKAAKQWRFRPGTRFGEPVPVLITIELAFTLR